jgi:hypothetical protein
MALGPARREHLCFTCNLHGAVRNEKFIACAHNEIRALIATTGHEIDMTAPLQADDVPSADSDVPFRRAPPADLRTRRRVYGSSYVENVTSCERVDGSPHPQSAVQTQSHVHCVDTRDEEAPIQQVSPTAR